MSGMETTTPSQSRLVAFSNGIVTNTRNAFISLLEPADILAVGGEDCSLARIVYELAFYNGRRTTDTAAALAVRMTFLLKEIQDTIAAPQVLSSDYSTSAGLGRDDILHTRDFVIPTANGYEDGGNNQIRPSMESSNWIRGEVKASRRFTNDKRLAIGWHTVLDGANVPQDFRFIGHVRCLIRHPK